MGSLLGTLGLGSDSFSSGSSYNSVLQCCDGVVDPLTLIAVLGSIVGVTVFLRQAIIDKVSVGRRKREVDALVQSNRNKQNQIYDHYTFIIKSVRSSLEDDNLYKIIKSGRIYCKSFYNDDVTKIDRGIIIILFNFLYHDSYTNRLYPICYWTLIQNHLFPFKQI